MLHSNLSPDEARVALIALEGNVDYLSDEDLDVLLSVQKKLKNSIDTAPFAWYNYMVSSGVSPNVAKKMIRNRYGRMIADVFGS